MNDFFPQLYSSLCNWYVYILLYSYIIAAYCGMVGSVVIDSICKCVFSVNGYPYIVCSSLYGNI